MTWLCEKLGHFAFAVNIYRTNKNSKNIHMLLESINLKRHEPSATLLCTSHVMRLQSTKNASTQSSSGKTFSISITQAAAVIRETYTIVEDKWETTFTPSDRHHLLTVKLKYAKSLNGSIIETSFLPNSQWTCTGTMAKGDHWTVNNFNASLDDKRTAIVSLSPVPQDFASDNVEVSNSMSSSVARFLCMFSNT